MPFVVGALWDMALPLGPTRDFTSSFSGRGFALDFRYWGLGKIGFGAGFIWNTMSDKQMTSIERENVTLSGEAVTELDANELLAKVYASPRDWRKSFAAKTRKVAFDRIVPYFALGFGGARAVRRVDLGVNRYVDESWHYAFVPELGVELPTPMFALLAAVRFNYIAGSGDAPEQMFMNFSLGGGF